jgi:hypothetical protein
LVVPRSIPTMRPMIAKYSRKSLRPEGLSYSNSF